MLITEEVANHLDVVRVRQQLPRFNQRRFVPPEVGQVDATDIHLVVDIEDAAYNGFGVAVLEVRCPTKEFESWMSQQDRSQKEIEILPFNPVALLLLHNGEESQHGVVRLDPSHAPINQHLLSKGNSTRLRQGCLCRCGLVHKVVEHLQFVQDWQGKVPRQSEDTNDKRFKLLISRNGAESGICEKAPNPHSRLCWQHLIWYLTLGPPEPRDRK
mmetsp:Transcript_5120/g.14299  ORF Transcript_5120/g.14299 Transcript_5120/m.14299 type:complete len:214 (+) Transcript_5120:819-1460(+)